MRTMCRRATRWVGDDARQRAHLAHGVWVYDRPGWTVSEVISSSCLLADDDAVDAVRGER